jgi:hypothetical protein
LTVLLGQLSLEHQVLEGQAAPVEPLEQAESTARQELQARAVPQGTAGLRELQVQVELTELPEQVELQAQAVQAVALEQAVLLEPAEKLELVVLQGLQAQAESTVLQVQVEHPELVELLGLVQNTSMEQARLL